MKHIFMYMAPAYFVYLLRNTCFKNSSTFGPGAFIKLALSVTTIFAISLGPFVYLGQTHQLISRLFPFKRGLFHSYWAPNFWAIYSTIDKFLETVLRYFGFNIQKSIITSGLTSEASYAVLPDITPIVTFILTILFITPCLIKLWRTKNSYDFVRSLVLCSLTAFLFGWHVHEKAILMPIVPLSLLAVLFENEARLFFLLSVTGYFSLFPLLPPGLETPIKYVFLLIHVNYCCCYLFKKRLKSFISSLELVYILGFIPISLIINLLPIFYPELMFLPLLITSAYCGIGITYCWSTYYFRFLKTVEKRKLN